jgi:dGTPase
LNLTFETREGILKHCSLKNAQQLGEIGERFIQHKQPGLEAQLANLADEIAYNNHDVDDGLRSGLLQENQLLEIALYARNRKLVEQAFPGLVGRRATAETVRRMINELILDLITTSEQRILAAKPQHIDDVRNAAPLIAFSEKMHKEAIELKQFLRINLYRHYQVQRMTSKARRCVHDLFALFMKEPDLLPPDYLVSDNETKQARKIADYIAGMTDRYAMREHRRLFCVDDI